MMPRMIAFVAIAALAASAVVPATAQDRYGSGSNDRYNSGNSGGEGFYRERNDRTVYFQYERRRFCGVQNEEQLKALGGSFNRVQVVDRLRLSGNNTGGCTWPNGFYRRQNEQAVYMLDGYGSGRGLARVCVVATPQQLRALGGNNRVKVVPGNSNLEAGRQPSRPC